MGGRGSRSGGAPGGGTGGLGGGGLGVGVPIAIPQGPPPNVAPGQPVPAISIAQLQAMDDTQFVNYLNGLKSTPIDPLTYYNDTWDTQRLIANMPELNRAPEVVDANTFASLPGQAIFRTVNAQGTESAVDICGRTMASDITTIGEGRMGDGFYFATSLTSSQRGYGHTPNNIQKTATMSAKLNSNARIVTESQLDRMVNSESRAVRNAILRMKSGGTWTESGYMAYALRKGYNVVSAGGICNVIDRSAATWSNQLVPMS